MIVGGESGHGARPFNLAWALKIKAQCAEQKVPFFFKQAGRDPVIDLPDDPHAWDDKDEEWGPDGAWPLPPMTIDKEQKLLHLRLKSGKGSDLAELPVGLRVREMPLGAAP